eukprot:TRINITY_DN24090_c0_g1_i1.p1 TRINITY_DN24090_c0_g1~~TRINITY_DN24090_c0_g1_i1.p1  ORF type:complete len:123 (+),score=15.60 TRINITY_DN24090_c0_g1_i1:212-580(+)
MPKPNEPQLAASNSETPVSLVDTVKIEQHASSVQSAEAKKQPAQETSRSTLFSQRTQTLLGVQILGTGAYVPEKIVTNDDLQTSVGADSEWIERRTGIRERRHAAEGQATSDLACEAARRAQ